MRHVIRPGIIALSDATEYAKEVSAITIAARYGLSPDEMVDLSLNINVLGPPAGAIERARQALSRLYQYPDIELREFRQSVARWHGLDPAMILPADGVDEALKLIAQVMVDPGDEVVIPVPTFPRYELEINIMGGIAVRVPLTPDFQVPVEEVLGRIGPLTKLVILCSPNNPTGVPIPRETVLRLLDTGPAGPLIIVDEAMIFPRDRGVVDLVSQHENLMLLRTFSKYHGIAGARVGYAVCNPDIVRYLEVVRPPFNVNLLGEAAALGAMADTGFLDRVWQEMGDQRSQLSAALEALPGVTVFPSQTGVLTFDVAETGWTSPALAEELASRGVVVVDCRSYAGLEHRDLIRVSIGSAADNHRLLAALRRSLGSQDGSV